MIEKQKKKVSIVLPVYNGEKYLSIAIESILLQTYENYELIIVNDCSTDSSEEIIRKYAAQDNRIKYVKNKQNMKLPNSLNIGFEIASGDYYTWTSDDNLYHKNAIEEMVNFLNNNDEIDMVYCDYEVIDQVGHKIRSTSVLEAERLKFANIVGACFLYRNKIVDEIGGYSSDFFLVEDYEYWLRISLKHQIKPLHLCLYDYRIHDVSLTETRKSDIYNAEKRLKWMYLKKFEKTGIEKNELFDYFDSILEYEPSIFRRIGKMIIFNLKHITYTKNIFLKYKRKNMLERK